MRNALKNKRYMSYVVKRLKHWANWFNKLNDKNGAGFNSYTPAYKLQTHGTMPQEERKPPSPYNDDAEEIDYIINEMETYDEKLANVLRAQYMGKGIATARAKELGMSSARFRSYVEMAHHWIAGRFLSVPNHPFSSKY